MCTKFIRISIILLLLANIPSFAQNQLSGRVYNKATGTPIGYASIYIEDLRVGAVSDSEGSYAIRRIPRGSYLVSVQILGYARLTQIVKIEGTATVDFPLSLTSFANDEVIITGNSIAKTNLATSQSITYVSNEYLNENSSTNVIDAVAKVPGVSAITDGQSISKPVIRGLGYNRVLTVNDGVEQMDQAWFDEFGIEADPDAVQRVEILKGPASLAYGSDGIAGVINLIPEQPLPEGKREGDVLFNYQTNNGLINNMVHLAGTQNGISWSARVDNIMAHAYKDPADGYVLNSQFSDFNMDGTVGIHRKWGYSQVHASYFDMATGIVDGTRDSTGAMVRQVSYPGLNGGAPTYVEPTKQELTSYTPTVINQRIRHTKIVWDNSIAVGDGGRITGTFSYQKNQRQETNDPTQPNTPDIYYSSDAVTYDLRYISRQYGGFNFSAGVNGAYQNSQSLGTVMLIPNYNFLEGGVFAIGNYQVGHLSLSGGVRYDLRRFTGEGHWIDTTNVAQAPVPANTPGSFEEFVPFTSNYGGLSASLGGVYNFKDGLYVKGNVAKGYRAPNVAECAADGVHDGTVVYEIGDPNLKPESNIEEDLTLGLNLKDVTFEANVFNNTINNFIYAKGLTSAGGGDSVSNLLSVGGSLFPDAPVYKYTQGTAQLYGGEASIDIHPAALPWIDLYSSLSIVQGGLLHVADSLRVLPFVPPARITIDLKFHVNKLGKGIKNAYVKVGMLTCFQQNKVYLQDSVASGLNTVQSPQEYAASQAATAGYTLFNAGIGGDLQSHGRTFCKVYISGTNLFNTVYMDYMSRFKYYPVNPVTNRVGVYNMGRNISLKVIIPFDFSKSKS
jgi:iron complex outermembrane receptor protein